jgi:hypothetical protein
MSTQKSRLVCHNVALLGSRLAPISDFPVGAAPQEVLRSAAGRRVAQAVKKSPTLPLDAEIILSGLFRSKQMVVVTYSAEASVKKWPRYWDSTNWVWSSSQPLWLARLTPPFGHGKRPFHACHRKRALFFLVRVNEWGRAGWIGESVGIARLFLWLSPSCL